MEAVLTILPPSPCAIIWRAASCIPIRQPNPFTSMMNDQFSSVTSMKFIGLLTPALLNITSSRPKASTVLSITARMSARSRTSTPAEITASSATPARLRFACATSSTCAALRSAKQTVAPSSSSASPMARPIPRAAPVTMHTRPSTPRGSPTACPPVRRLVVLEKYGGRIAKPAPVRGGISEHRAGELAHVLLRDLRRVEVVQERHVLACQHVERRLQGRFGVIDRRLVDGAPVLAALHSIIADGEVGGADEGDTFDATGSQCSVQCAHAHVVIAGIDPVDIVILNEEGLHHALAVLAVPVARLTVDQRHVRADLGQTLLEAFAALDGGGVARLTGDLDHAGLVLNAQFGEPVTHDLGRACALRHVIGAGEGRDEVKAVFGDVGVGDDHRYLGLERFAHGRDHGLTVGRPDDHRVHFLLDEVLDLRDLARHVATGVKHD